MSDPYRDSRQAKEQRIYDQGIQELATLDFSSCEAVISWVEKMYDPVDCIYVKKDKQKIISTFQKNRWHVGVNTGSSFKIDDKRNFAGYIVGQWLDSFYPNLMAKFIGQWRDKFCK